MKPLIWDPPNGPHNIIFEDPPPDGRKTPKARSGEFTAWLANLRRYPGTWAKYHRPCSPGNASHIRKGDSFSIRPGEYEVRTLNIPGDSKVILYARFVGDDR